MAVNVVIPLLIPLEENLHNTTRLLPGAGGPVQFTEPRYCVLLAEDAPPAVTVTKVTASHKDGARVRYRITGGNRDGLFTINRRSGLITLAAPLDYELHPKHELVVAAEAGGKMVHTIVQVTVADVNDNAPQFLESDLTVTVVEEDDSGLPATILKIVAQDVDIVDQGRLVYSVGGDGVDGYGARDAFFTINPHTGELIQLRALDRDPPRGRETWRVRVQVRDGQRMVPSSSSSTSSSTSFSSGGRRGGRYPLVTLGHQQLYPAPPSALQEHQALSANFRLPQQTLIDGNRIDEAENPNPSWNFQYKEAKDDGYNLHEKPSRATTNKSSVLASQPSLVVIARSHVKKDEITQKRRKASAEKRRRMKDKRTKNGGERIGGDRRKAESSSRNRKLKPPNIPPFLRYGIRAGGRKTHLQLPPERWSDEGSLSDRGNEGGDGGFMESPSLSYRKSEVEYSSHNKHQHQIVPHHTRKLLTFQESELSKSSPRQSYFQNMTQITKGHRVHDIKPPPLWGGSSVTNEGLMPHLKYDPRYFMDGVNYLDSLSFMGISNASVPLPNKYDNTNINKNINLVRKTGVEDINPEPTEILKNPKPNDYLVSQKKRFVKRFASNGSGCQDFGGDFSMNANDITRNQNPYGNEIGRDDGRGYNRGYDGGGGGGGIGGGRDDRDSVHVVETIVTVLVQDINDNAPSFPNATIFGEVQENGPIDLSVAVVSAWDADDDTEGTNALITYSIEKNVIEERSGQAIFAVHPQTGLVRTAICCLDRETTPQYHIQVVAVDGGGLKGTGTVVVRLADVNDNSPRLTRELWQVEVNETWAAGPPDNATLVELSTLDHDTSNYFYYRVVESSGWGWEHFAVRTHGTVGELYANRTLDFEDPAHRRGFRFMVQVTDRGRGGWSDARHTDTAWVAVQLLDLNDNPPEFRRPHVHITVREDTPPGTLLATLPARDPDRSGQQGVNYHVWAAWGALTVDSGGGVRLWRALDREAPGGEKAIAKVIGVDEGIPPLSSTATLTITVTDVNDCPPRLLPPTVLHIREGVSGSRLGLLTATDDDVWALGHGPPFNLSLAPSNPKHVLQLLALKYDPTVDSGRGGAEVWTLGPIDREEYPQLTVEIIVSDAGGLAATQPVTVIIDDVNDNPMRPAAKTVHLWKIQGGGVDAGIGRVYVDDPDDWDLQDKKFSWAGPPHPLFSLNTNTGAIYASTQLREGRYELHFSVSDRVWRQNDVRANVTVTVRYLSPESLAHAVPVTLTPTTPAEITSGWSPKRGGGGLGLLSAAVTKVVKQDAKNVQIVSVYGHPSSDVIHATAFPKEAFPRQQQTHVLGAPFACVWVSVRKEGGGYMDPIKLQGLLALHIQQLEEVMKLRVLLEEPSREAGVKGAEDLFPHDVPGGVSDPSSSVASLASTSLRLQVVDTNSTSLVTPRLSRAIDCRAHIRDADDSCMPTSCMNGGRCVRTDHGNRCICPGGSWGRRCKILSRTFKGGGWAWVRPLPPCLPTTLSLRLLTTQPQALLLYSGPLASTSPRPRQPPSPMLVLQLVEGRPQVLLEGGRGPLKLEVNTTLDTGSWHTIHIHLNAQGVTLMVDHCARGWLSDTANDSHCLARAAWVDDQSKEGWISSVPLQVGGLAHPYPHPHLFGWSSAPVQQGLYGCISHLKINRHLMDLGEPAFSSGSAARCSFQEAVCKGECGFRGQCVGGLKEPKCDCDSGWEGPNCATPTVPITFGQGSFMKLSLSFTPDPYSIMTQLRVRTQGRSDGLLLQMATQQRHIVLTIRLRGGIACAMVSGAPEVSQEVCVEDYLLGDGTWHTIYVARNGYDLSISVDDGDGWRHNETLTSLLGTVVAGQNIPELALVPPVPIVVEEKEGLTIGGVPNYVDLSLVSVNSDLTDSCIDDVRVSGHPLPLPTGVNTSDWGQVTALQHVDTGCLSPDLCVNTSCLPPLSCHQTWRHTTCSCGSGGQLLGGICQDVDECVYQPCLHGGSCTNLYPGYQCSCSPGTSGYNCEWQHLPAHSQRLTPPMAIAALTLSLLVLVLVGVFLTIWIHRSRTARGGGGLRQTGVESDTDVGSVMGVIETPLSAQDAHSLASKEEITLLESLKMRLPTKNISPEGTKQHISSISSSTRLPDESLSLKEVSVIIPRTSSISSISRRSSSAENVLLVAGGKRPLVTAIAVAGGVPGTTTSTKGHPQVVEVVSGSVPPSSAQPLLAQDDLRAYAYEGDGSPSGSLTSTVLGLRTESLEDNHLRPLVPEYGEVLDLLKTLPDAVGSSPVAPQEGLRGRIDGDRTFLRARGHNVTPPSRTKEICETLSRTNSQCGVGGGVSGVGGGATSIGSGGVGTCGTLPHGVKRTPVERKTSLTEFSTAC